MNTYIGLTIQIYFRRNPPATEMHISLCTFGSEMPIWRRAASALCRTRLISAGNKSTTRKFGLSSFRIFVPRNRRFTRQVPETVHSDFYTIRVSLPLLGRHLHALMARLRIETIILQGSWDTTSHLQINFLRKATTLGKFVSNQNLSGQAQPTD